MNIKEIKEMLNLMNDNNLTELEVEKDGTRIRLKKATSEAQSPIVIERQHIASPSAAAEAAQLSKEKASRTIEIKAPMVGTFYRAPTPEAPPYVEVGQVVEAGQVVCIIEAMKLMNEIEADVDGTVVEVFVENAKPVEFGQKLFALLPLS